MHGFADYFFQTGMADFWVGNGYDFYALDLRKYGRSLRPHQTATTSPTCAPTTRSSTSPTRSWPRATTTSSSPRTRPAGSLSPLWLHDRGLPAAGVFLNAPWIDMHGDAFTRLMALPVIHRLGALYPMREMPREVSGVYARSLHRDHLGEWDFDLGWKPLAS